MYPRYYNCGCCTMGRSTSKLERATTCLVCLQIPLRTERAPASKYGEIEGLNVPDFVFENNGTIPVFYTADDTAFGREVSSNMFVAPLSNVDEEQRRQDLLRAVELADESI